MLHHLASAQQGVRSSTAGWLLLGSHKLGSCRAVGQSGNLRLLETRGAELREQIHGTKGLKALSNLKGKARQQ